MARERETLRACSATGELWVDEHSATVEGVRVLRDVGHLDVVFVLAQLLSDLWVYVILG